MALKPAAVDPAGEELAGSDAALDASSLSDTEYLAKLGYKQELKRDLGLFSCFGVQFSSIAVTSSMFTTPTGTDGTGPLRAACSTSRDSR